MAIQDLGVIHRTATLWSCSIFKYATEQVWSEMVWYCSGWTTPADLIAINNDTDAVTSTSGPMGRPYGFFMHPDDGLFYIGSDRGTSYPGQYGKWNHRTGVYTALGAVPRTADGIQFATFSDETPKRVFFCSNRKGGLHAWGTEEQDYGILDDPGSYPDVRYIPSAQVNANYAYCEMKQSAAYGDNNKCYLCIVNLTTGVVTLKWKGTAGLLGAMIYRGVDQNIYINTSAGILAYDWWLVNGTDDPIGVSQPSTLSAYWSGRDTTPPIYHSVSGYDVSTLKLYPWVTGDVTIRYKRDPDTEWREKDATLINVEDYPLQRAFEDFDGNFISFGGSYAPTSRYYVQTNENTKLGIIPSLSGYCGTLDHPRNLIWIGGYPAGQFWKYDPALSFDDSVQITVMPDPSIPKYYYHAITGVDRLIWLGASYIRQTANNCALVWYNPDTNTADHIKWEDYILESVVSNRARNKIVVSLSGADSAPNGKLAVVPVRKKGISKYLTPLGNVNTQGLMIGVETSKATVNRFVGITNGANYKTYCIHIGTGEFVWGPITNTGRTSTVDGDHQTVTFAHGYVWYYEGPNIVKLNPANGTISAGITMDYTGEMLWIGDYLFHWDATSKHLYKIPKADLGL